MDKNNWYWKKKPKEDGKSGCIWLAVNTCTICGAEFNNGNVAASKYCPACAKEVQAKQNRERVRRHREKLKQAKYAEGEPLQ